jgi:restriction system protein
MTKRREFLYNIALSTRSARKSKKILSLPLEKALHNVELTQIAYLKSQQEAMLAAQKGWKITDYYLSLPAKERQALQRKISETEKEMKKCHLNLKNSEVILLNAQLEDKINQLENILKATLAIDDYFDIQALKIVPIIPSHTPSNYKLPIKPDPQNYIPEQVAGIKKLLPSIKAAYQSEYEKAARRYKQDLEKFKEEMLTIKRKLEAEQEEYKHKILDTQKRADLHNASVEKFFKEFEQGDPQAIIDFFTYVLEASLYPENFPQRAKLAFIPESKQLVVEYDLPAFSVIPEIGLYKYIKTKDEAISSPRPLAQRKSLYSSLIAQITIRTIHELFEADRAKHLETIVFNGYVDSIDRGTGKHLRECLATVRVVRDIFLDFDLSRVDPIACLKVLNASVSKVPEELAPVKPVLEFSMVDPRFIEETDVISSLDTRPNLMELKPSDFEALIANLFEKMGLETRQTQASRDGGVDCVAYDTRPILGGKVVIQAKRYKHTVGVSAVRDLYGTLQNEGASKGILVTTSGYGKAAFDFASGKPIELLSGSNLLYLLETHAGVKAKIVPPENWKDPHPDSASEEVE